MNRTWLNFLTGWLVCGLLFCEAQASDVVTFKKANQQFEAADYMAAAASFQALIDGQGASASRYCNLGNCYYRLGQFGPSILAYERAKLLAPRDTEILTNLKLVSKVASITEPVRKYPQLARVTDFLSRNECSWCIVLAGFYLASLALVFGIWKIDPPGLRRVIYGTALLAIFAILFVASVLAIRRDEANRGVVLMKDANVLLSPFAKAEIVTSLHAGQPVQLKQAAGDFIYVQASPAGSGGWLQQSEVARILGN
jgi:tetratricopeptide (TPR) repeat protein